ncbi:hypothetical protein, partial [Cytobacillus oceanisediminis]
MKLYERKEMKEMVGYVGVIWNGDDDMSLERMI